MQKRHTQEISEQQVLSSVQLRMPGIYKISGMEGLLVITVVMDIIAVVCSFFLRSESSKTIIADRKEMRLQADIRQQENSGDTMQKKQEKDSIRQILAIFKNKKAVLFVISLAIFSIAWLLINFFYVVKLENCGLSVEWMSLIILSYSAVQMLAEPILGKLSDGKNGKSSREKLPGSYSCHSRGGISSFWSGKIQGSRTASNADIAVAFKSSRIPADGSGKSVCGRSGVWQPACGNAVCA